MGSDPRDQPLRHGGVGQVAGPRFASVPAAENLPEGGADEKHVVIRAGAFDGGNRGAVERRRHGLPGTAVVIGAPQAIGAQPQLLDALSAPGLDLQDCQAPKLLFIRSDLLGGNGNPGPLRELLPGGPGLARAMAGDFQILRGPEHVRFVGVVELDPASVTRKDAGEFSRLRNGSAGSGGHSGDQGSVILGASAEDARIRLRHVGGIKHGGDHAVGAILPRLASVGAQRDPAVVTRINPAGWIDDHGMVIAVHDSSAEKAGPRCRVGRSRFASTARPHLW